MGTEGDSNNPVEPIKPAGANKRMGPISRRKALGLTLAGVSACLPIPPLVLASHCACKASMMMAIRQNRQHFKRWRFCLIVSIQVN